MMKCWWNEAAKVSKTLRQQLIGINPFPLEVIWGNTEIWMHDVNLSYIKLYCLKYAFGARKNLERITKYRDFARNKSRKNHATFLIGFFNGCCLPFPGKYIVSSLMEKWVPGIVNRHWKIVSGWSSPSLRILVTEMSKRPSPSIVKVVVSPRWSLLNIAKKRSQNTFLQTSCAQWPFWVR